MSFPTPCWFFGTDVKSSFKKQFSSYLEDGVGSDDIEEIYTNAYAAIRADPTFKPTDKTKDWAAECKKNMTPRLTYAQRKERIEAKIARFQAGGDAGESRIPILPFHIMSVRDADHVSHSERRR